jgi:hypothetical protein
VHRLFQCFIDPFDSVACVLLLLSYRTRTIYRRELSVAELVQDVFNLKGADMMAGNYLGHQGPPLEVDDAYYIGVAASKNGTNVKVCILNGQWVHFVLATRQPRGMHSQCSMCTLCIGHKATNLGVCILNGQWVHFVLATRQAI